MYESESDFQPLADKFALKIKLAPACTYTSSKKVCVAERETAR
jgi:hypothetical protein